MIILIVVPQLAHPARGNRVTAERWGRIFADLGHEVIFDHEFRDQECDVLIALHAVRSAPSILAFAAERPGSPLLVALTGTDIYPGGDDLPADAPAVAARSMSVATRLVVMQPLAAEAVGAEWRDKVVVIFQSFPSPQVPETAEATRGFDVCVVGELRDIKDPFRAALAARRLPHDSRLRILQLGAAGRDEVAGRAAKEEQSNPRYSWLGEVPRDEALALIAGSALLVNSSINEGSANVLTEALVLGTPVLASSVPGNVGVLGEEYPGLFPAQDTEALAELMQRAEAEPEFYEELRQACAARAEIAEPRRERQAWEALLDELSGPAKSND